MFELIALSPVFSFDHSPQLPARPTIFASLIMNLEKQNWPVSPVLRRWPLGSPIISGAFGNCSATASLLPLGSRRNGEGDLALVLPWFPARPGNRSFVCERGPYAHPPVSGADGLTNLIL